MIINQKTCDDLRDIFCNAVIKVFGNTEKFLDFIETDDYPSDYDCYLDGSSENYIINRETGEYINWYKTHHIGRCINISISSQCENISKWIEGFLLEFKGGDY